METALTTAAERPVFVATDDRRARRLRYLAAFAVALAGAWVVALVIGMLGIGRMPGLSLPVVAHGADKAPAVAAREPAVAPASVAAVTRSAAVMETRSAAPRSASPSHGAAAPKRAKKASTAKAKAKATAPAATAPAATAPAAPTTPRQGWARRGLTTPPGRTRQAEPRTKTTPSSEHPRQQAATDTTTAPATPAATPVPPGQQKKADDPTPQN
jgi:hypothetical protein